MADYYPLIARAIAGLDPSAPGESRRALYERARAALIAQLRSVEPPLSESEITRERLSLEEAVRKVESEAAQRAREVTRPGGGGDRARAGDAFRASTRPAARPGEGAPAARPNSSPRHGQAGPPDRIGRGATARAGWRRAKKTRPNRGGVSVQERDRGWGRTGPRGRRDPVGQVRHDGHQRAVEAIARERGSAKGQFGTEQAEDRRSRWPAV